MTELSDYLDYYKTLQAPKYGILVKGPWGSGKTFQVLEALEKSEYYYVSLFGVKSTAEIQAKLHEVAAPKTAKKRKFFQKSKETTKDAGGYIAISGLLFDALSHYSKIDLDPKRIIIFDDLERAILQMETVLGYINTFIEHQKLKVIIIAHDEKISDEIKAQKEKIIGQTIEVTPQIERAYDAFVREIETSGVVSAADKPKMSKFFEEKKKLITNIFNERQIEGGLTRFYTRPPVSLRVLRFVLNDLSRLIPLIQNKYFEYTDSFEKVLSEFCVINIEFRLGNISAKTISKDWYDLIQSVWMHEQRDTSNSNPEHLTKNEMFITNAHYPEANINNMILDQIFFRDALINAKYEAHHINQILSNSHHFKSKKDQPSWYIYHSYDLFENELVEKAIEELKEKFDQRGLTDPAQLLHLFSLRYFMSYNGDITDSYDEITQQCMQYIDDLDKIDKIVPKNTAHSHQYDNKRGLKHSYRIHSDYNSKFQSVYREFTRRQEDAFLRSKNLLSIELLDQLKETPDLFINMISTPIQGAYYETPILHLIKPRAFVETWLSLPNAEHRKIKSALERRHHGGELKKEKDWILSIERELKLRAKRTKGFRAKKIESLIPRFNLRVISSKNKT